MAERLAKLFGTEEDKVNCSFFFKIGACRHGDKCTRLHYKPPVSQTLLIPHMYDNPPIALAMAEGAQIPEDQAMEAVRHFEDFYEEVFLELANYGELEELIVCDNIGDHLVGNVYVKFAKESDAENCMKCLTGRYYAGKLIIPEYSPVTDFREARCRQYDEGVCSRGGYCNFMHLKHLSKSFNRSLFRQMYDEHPEYKLREKNEESDRDHKGSRRGNKKNRSKSKSSSHHHHKKKIRSRSRSKHHDKKLKKKDKKNNRDSNSRESGSRPREMNSEERRAMIEMWNKQADEKKEEEEIRERERMEEGKLPDKGLD